MSGKIPWIWQPDLPNMPLPPMASLASSIRMRSKPALTCDFEPLCCDDATPVVIKKTLLLVEMLVFRMLLLSPTSAEPTHCAVPRRNLTVSTFLMLMLHVSCSAT